MAFSPIYPNLDAGIFSFCPRGKKRKVSSEWKRLLNGFSFLLRQICIILLLHPLHTISVVKGAGLVVRS